MLSMLSLYMSHHTNLCWQEFCMVVIEDWSLDWTIGLEYWTTWWLLRTPQNHSTVKIQGSHLHEIGNIDQN